MSKDKIKRLSLQITLFVVTFITTTHAGGEWTHGTSIWIKGYSWNDFWSGLSYSVPFLLILTVHEFGHYITALKHKIKTSLPYYIPFPPLFPLSIGTMGAVIRIKERVKTTYQHFDIGIAGPIAGFIVALCVIWYGFENLPPKSYIFDVHPEYEVYGENYEEQAYSNLSDSTVSIQLGQNLTFLFFEKFVADPELVPDHREMMHYPYLFAGFLALFFTALNLLPVGQLDGGHVLYGLFGRRMHGKIARVIFLIFLFYAGLGYITPWDKQEDLMLYTPLYILFLYFTLSRMFLSKQRVFMFAMIVFVGQFVTIWLFPNVHGYSGWLVFAFLVGRIIGIYHPGAIIEQKLDTKRQILGWIALLIFIVSFSPAPLIFE